MALTINRSSFKPLGTAGERVRAAQSATLIISTGSFTFPSSYTAGGESLTPADMGLADVLFVQLTPVPSAGATAGGILVQYDFASQKAMAFSGTAAAQSLTVQQVKSGENLSAYTVRFLAIGTKVD